VHPAVDLEDIRESPFPGLDLYEPDLRGTVPVISGYDVQLKNLLDVPLDNVGSVPLVGEKGKAYPLGSSRKGPIVAPPKWEDTP